MGKTGGDSLPWGDCRGREVKTMNANHSFGKVSVEESRQMVNTPEKVVSSIDNYC